MGFTLPGNRIAASARPANDRDDAAIDGRRQKVLASDGNSPQHGAGFRVKRLKKTVGRRDEKNAVLDRRALNLFKFPIKRRLREPRSCQSDGVRVGFGDQFRRRDSNRVRVRRDERAKTENNRCEKSFHA